MMVPSLREISAYATTLSDRISRTFPLGPPGRIAFGPIYAHRSHYKPVHMVSTHCRGSPLMMLPRTTPEVQVVVSNPCWESREASVSPWARSRVSRRRTTVEYPGGQAEGGRSGSVLITFARSR